MVKPNTVQNSVSSLQRRFALNSIEVGIIHYITLIGNLLDHTSTKLTHRKGDTFYFDGIEKETQPSLIETCNNIFVYPSPLSPTMTFITTPNT